MRGHIRERGKGNWYAVIDTRDPRTGKRKRKWHSLEAKGKREAQVECAALISSIKGGTYLEPIKVTVAEYMERWLEHTRSQVSPKTFERYCGVVRGNILPALGAVPISKLQPAQISEMYRQSSPRRPQGREERGPFASQRSIHAPDSEDGLDSRR